MTNYPIQSLPIAVRVYPEPEGIERRTRSRGKWKCPDAMFVFDTETRTDATQKLTFGSCRFIVQGRCLEENLFCADDLPNADLELLKRYVAIHDADTVRDGVRKLGLLTRKQFVDRLYKLVYKARCLLVGFNLPFDLSRVAFDVTSARGRFAGGFALELWSYMDKLGHEQFHPYRPRVGTKHIDSKRALKGFTARNNPDPTDLIPENSTTGQPENGFKFRGNFLDLRTIAFALTDKGYTLASACEDFGVEHGKYKIERHGIVTEDYVSYNRRDVLASSELAVKLLAEYENHPINLQVTKAYSPASIGKAYLRTMDIPPILERQPNFPKEYLGYTQSGFFGGRTSAHIRKFPVPIVYTDFLSMYTTVNSLMGLWRFVVAGEIKVRHCKSEVIEFLRGLTSRDLFDPSTWKHLTGFVKLIPNGDILPSRGKYNPQTNDWQVAVNYLHLGDGGNRDALWFSLPDVVTSVILTGRIPEILDAFRIEPHGILPVLKTKLRGVVEVDPAIQNFFQVSIEERKCLSSRTDLSEADKKRLDKALKVLANATSYGIFAEMNRQESDEKVRVRCSGIDSKPFTCRVAHPDVPGEYCFPPLAALITGAARLMLGLLEHCVTEQGGTYAMEDTDSMAIVATKHGGTIPCPGGENGTIKALSWKQVEAISDRFIPLNPYDRKAVPGSILKIEDENYDPVTKRQRQLYCLAISAKRYVPFLKNKNDNPFLLRKGTNSKSDHWSQHGLGHLLNPSDPESEDREWIAQVWTGIIRCSLGFESENPKFDSLPAIGRISVSSPAVLRALDKLNKGKKYVDQIKPFNFLLTCHVMPFGHPLGTDPEHFHLIAPYESDPRKWEKMKWTDLYSGKQYRITTKGSHADRHTARVKTYEEVVQEYEFHPESKCADSEGNPCGKQTVGLLQRRRVQVERIKYIGKESNSLEEVESGLIHSAQSVYTEYPDPRRDEWRTQTLPAMNQIRLSVLQSKTSLSRRMLIDARTGRRRPHRKNQELLAAVIRDLRLLEG